MSCCDTPELNPVPCFNNTLQATAAYAQIVGAPEEMTPIFYADRQCGGQRFPQRELPIVANPVYPDGKPPDGFLPEQLNGLNQLRIISKRDYDLLVQGNGTMSSSQINYLTGAKSDSSGNNGAQNCFTPIDGTSTNTFTFILSIYIPPNYEAYFFPQDPTVTPIAQQQTTMLRMDPGTLITNTCCQKLQWGPTNQYAFLTKDLNPPQTPLTETECCPFKGNVRHGAPFLVLVRLENLQSLILDMCSKNRGVMIGPYDLPVWKPQTSGCDSFMTSFCAQPVSTMTDDEQDICACFIQQRTLDETYGEGLEVPVLCFGSDAKKRVEKNCVFNQKAYKTFDMQQSSCSYAECLQMASALPGTGTIQCQGSTIAPKLPDVAPVVSVSVSPTDDDDYTESTVISIPSWIWYLFATFIICLLAFLVILNFVRPVENAPINETAQ